MINEIIKDAQVRMNKSIEALKNEMSKIRTGRAHPGLLDQVMVDYYGAATPLKQVANVVVEDARMLNVTPWERPMVAAIEKAIMTADLGLNPSTNGNSIRVPMPPLTEERRRDLVKVVKNEAEAGRVSVRNIRRDANGDIKELLKEKEVSEDEARKGETQIQKITDKSITVIEEMLVAKEKEVMEV